MTFAKFGLFGLALFVAATGGAKASDEATADVRACLYLPSAPEKPVSFKFVAGGPDDQCLRAKGKNAKGVAETEGLTCVDVGTVQTKSNSSGGDFCLTADSIWTLAYSADNVNHQGGMTKSQWSNPLFGDNSMELEDQAPGTVVCGSESMCTQTEWKWRKRLVPEIFVIFKPNRSR